MFQPSSNKMTFILYFEKPSEKQRYYLAELPRFQTTLMPRTWRLLYKILKTARNCLCKSTFTIGMVTRPDGGPDRDMTEEEILQHVGKEEEELIPNDLDPDCCDVIEHSQNYMCIFCDYMPLWFHVHPVLRFLEILHKNIVWTALAENVYYSGWIPIQQGRHEKLMILFEVNLNPCSLRFITSRIHSEKRKRVRSFDTICGGQQHGMQFKSAGTLFKLSSHRPFPKLMHLALSAACDKQCLFDHLPPTLQKQLEELHMWLGIFQPKGGKLTQHLFLTITFSFSGSFPLVAMVGYRLEYNSQVSGVHVLARFPLIENGRSSDWFAVCAILKSFDQCKCSAGGSLSLIHEHGFGLEHVVTLSEILERFGNTDLKILSHLLKRSWSLSNFAKHPILRLLEVVHRDVPWMCIGTHLVFTGWIPVTSYGHETQKALYQINKQNGTVQMVTGTFYHSKNGQELYRIVPPCSYTQHSASAFFSLATHRPFPRLQDICLLPVLKEKLLFKQLPQSLQDQYTEWREWLLYFGHFEGENPLRQFCMHREKQLIDIS